MITRPTLLLDEKICRLNIMKMAKKANQNDLVFRPHFKTHQSKEIGNWFREYGVDRITVSSIKMAEYFALHGWENICIAFPVNIREIKSINALASKIHLTLLLESIETIKFLDKNLEHPVDFYIKIDPDYGRTGIHWRDTIKIDEILEIEMQSNKINFNGFLSHAGNSYKARNHEEIMNIHDEYLAKLHRLKKQYQKEYKNIIISIGDTPTCSVAETFDPANEIRPGNFVFYDLMQYQIGSCTLDDIATFMACPVVAIHPERNSLLIHGGSVHFSSDFILDSEGKRVYGQLINLSQGGEKSWVQGAYLSKLSQEHGTVTLPEGMIQNISAGDLIHIVPIHSCTNSHLMKSYFTLEGKKYSHLEGTF